MKILLHNRNIVLHHLTKDMSQQLPIVWTGQRCNGKSELIPLLHHVLGEEYCRQKEAAEYFNQVLPDDPEFRKYFFNALQSVLQKQET